MHGVLTSYTLQIQKLCQIANTIVTVHVFGDRLLSIRSIVQSLDYVTILKNPANFHSERKLWSSFSFPPVRCNAQLGTPDNHPRPAGPSQGLDESARVQQRHATFTLTHCVTHTSEVPRPGCAHGGEARCQAMPCAMARGQAVPRTRSHLNAAHPQRRNRCVEGPCMHINYAR